MPKPFDLSELEARLQVLLRRQGRTKTSALRWGPLEMQPDTGEVQLHGQPLALTQREAAALRAGPCMRCSVGCGAGKAASWRT